MKLGNNTGPASKRGHRSQILPGIVEPKFVARLLFLSGVIQRAQGGGFDWVENPGFVFCCSLCDFSSLSVLYTGIFLSMETSVVINEFDILLSNIYYLSRKGAGDLLGAETHCIITIHISYL